MKNKDETMIRQDLELAKTSREHGTHNFNSNAVSCSFDVLVGQQLKRISFVHNERYNVITEEGRWTTLLTKLSDEITEEFDIFCESFINFMIVETETNKYLIFQVFDFFNGSIELETIHGLDDLQEMMGRTITKASTNEHSNVIDQHSTKVNIVHALTADDLFTSEFHWKLYVSTLDTGFMMIDLSLEDKFLELKNSKLSTSQNWLHKLRREFNNKRYLSMLQDAHAEAFNK